MNPIELFKKWFEEERKISNLNLPAACCLSTTGIDGYPNSRFVSLKEVVNNSFVITGSFGSRKGIEIDQSPKAALSFWWTSTERQVRIQGDVTMISDQAASKYFEPRNRDSKIVSFTFQQGSPIQSFQQLHNHFSKNKEELVGKEVKPPKNWGGIALNPIRIEFMEFKKSRLHERTLYSNVNNNWTESILQP